MDTAGTVRLAGLGVHDTHDFCDHRVTHATCRRFAFTPRIEPRHRHPHDTADHLDREALAHDLSDDLPFGSVWAVNNSLARFVTASSVSSSRIRWRAAANSADSTVVIPVAALDQPDPGFANCRSSDPTHPDRTQSQ